MRAKHVAPFVALAVAAVVAALFVVLLGSDPPNNETAETNLMDLPAPEAAVSSPMVRPSNCRGARATG